MKITKTINLRKALLAGTAIVAVGAFAQGAQAADLEIVTGNALTSTLAADNITNATATGATDNATLNTNTAANRAITNIDIDHNAALVVSDEAGNSNNLAISGYVDIATGTTFTLTQGLANQAGSDADIAIAGDLGGTAATTLTRGGTLALVGANDMATAQAFAANGNTYLTGVTVTGGTAATAAGSAITATFGDANTDTFNVTTLSVTGGNSAVNVAGGASTVNVAGPATIGGATTVTGGDNVAGGNGAGGDAALTFASGVTSSSTLAITAGAQGGTGNGGNASVTTNGATTFTAITLDDAAAGTGAATLTASATGTAGTDGFTVTGAIDGATAGEGALVVLDDDNTKADAVTFASAVGGTKALKSVTVGGATTKSGNAVFNSTVDATTITVGGQGNGGSAATTATFKGAVGSKATVTTFGITAGNADAEDATATINSDLKATNIVFTDADNTADATLIADANGSSLTITGALAGSADGNGILQIGDGTDATDATVVGTIGGAAAAGADDLEAINVKTKSTLRLSKSAYFGAVDDVVALNMDGNLYLDSAANAVVVDAVDGRADYDGNVYITGKENVTLTSEDEFTFDGNLSVILDDAADKLVIGSDSDTVTFAGDSDTTITLGAELELSDELVIGDGTDNKSLTINLRKSAGFIPGVDGGTGVDAIESSAGFDIKTGSTLKIGIDAGSAEFDSGTEVVVFDGANNGAQLNNVAKDITQMITDGNIVLVDTAFLDLVNNGSDDEDIKIKINVKDATGIVASNAVAGNAITGLASASTTGNLQTLRSNLMASSSSEAAQDVLEASISSVDAGAVVGGMTVGNQTAGLNSARLASLRSGQTGMAAGNGAEGLKAWGQVFGSTGQQDEREGIVGYDVDTYGMAVGIDTENLAEDAVVGLAFAYADTEVDSDNASSNKTEIDSYQVALYGDYDLDERTYISGQISYMWSSNDTTRHNVGGISGVNATGDYDASQFGIRAEVGRDYAASDMLTLTPSFMVNYAYYDADSYTESGAGTANLMVGGADLSVFEIGAGLDAAWTVENADGSYFKPTVGLGVRHDLVGDEYAATNQFTGAGAAFEVKGFDPADTTFDVGAGVTYFTTGGWDLSAEYNYEFKSDYDSHNGMLKAAYNF